MRNKELLDYYLHTSKDDRRVCLKLLDDKEYLPSLFYAHLSIEKLLKRTHSKKHTTITTIYSPVRYIIEKIGT